MEDKKVVALSDEALDDISGGVVIEGNYVLNQDTGEKFTLLVSRMEAFMFAGAHPCENDTAMIEQMKAAGIVVG